MLYHFICNCGKVCGGELFSADALVKAERGYNFRKLFLGIIGEARLKRVYKRFAALTERGFDNLEENFSGTERYEKIEEGISALEEGIENIQAAIDD